MQREDVEGGYGLNQMMKKYTGICPNCDLTYEGESRAMLKMALLSHTVHARGCDVSSPYEIDDMIYEVIE